MDIKLLELFENIRTNFLTKLFTIFTFLGEETFIVFIIVTIYFAVNKKLGQYLTLTVFSSIMVNQVIKDLVKRPRPYIDGIVERVKINRFISTDLSNSYSFPSGHSQVSTAVFFGAVQKKPLIYKLIAAVLVLFVIVSRLYLGVHYLSDCMAGAFIGIIAVLFWSFIFNNYPKLQLIIFKAFTALSFISLFFAISPDTLKALGVISGGAIGIMLENKFVNFRISQKLILRILRVIIGLTLMAVIKFGLKAAFPASAIFIFIRYFLLILFMTYIYPLSFKLLKF